MPRRGGRTHGSVVEEAFRFALWAACRARPPSWQEIQGYLGCHSTKARSWRRHWLACLPVHSQDTPTPAATRPAPTRPAR